MQLQMQWMNQLKIRTRLFSLIGFFLLVFIAFAIFYNNTMGIVKVNGPYYNQIAQGKDLIADIMSPTEYIVESYLQILIMQNETEKIKVNKQIEKFQQLKNDFYSRHAFWEKELPPGRIKEQLMTDAFNPAKMFYEIAEKEFIPAILNGDYSKSFELMVGELAKKYELHQTKISEVVQMTNQWNAKNEKTVNEIVNTRTLAFLLLIVLFVPVVILLGLAISLSIVNPIREMNKVVARLVKGDVNVNVTSASNDEIGEMMHLFGQMIESIRKQVQAAERIAEGDLQQPVKLNSEQDAFGKALNKMIASLNSLISRLKKATERVSVGSNEISDTSQTLSQGATEQASSLEEITSSMTEIGSQTKTNAENASQADQLSKTTQQAAVNGSQKMGEMMGAMGAIQGSSKEIVKIIKVIDDIAFQTNLLALNAAVEAARAGRHGKGFAVVAEEVRSLAARSAKAAKETAELIDDSMRKVENGLVVANLTGSALQQIEEGIGKVTDLIGEIAAASNEQAQGISQINQGLGQIDVVTQHTTSGAEELASAAQELKKEALDLSQMVKHFKIRETAERTHETAHWQGVKETTPVQVKTGWGVMNPVKKNSLQINSDHTKPMIALDDKEFGKY